jgi:predicted nucleotidyltransferase/biotin operon repressor
MLEKLFTSKARVKVLETVLLNKGREFHTRELARRIGVSAPYVMKELQNLKSLGLIVERREGNMVLYSINPSSSVIEDIKRIFLKTESLGTELFRVLKGSKESVRYALIYGSFAKGTEVTSSDIDLLVVGDVDEDAILKAVMKAQSRIGREINFIVWTEREFAAKRKEKVALLREIARTPVIMIIGDADEFKRSIK